MSSCKQKCMAELVVYYRIFDVVSLAVKDVNVHLESERSEGISTPSRDDDSTLPNPGTNSSILDDNTKSDSGQPEVSWESQLCSISVV